MIRLLENFPSLRDNVFAKADDSTENVSSRTPNLEKNDSETCIILGTSIKHNFIAAFFELSKL